MEQNGTIINFRFVFGNLHKNPMSIDKKPYVCPAELAGTLDNAIRRLVHNPRKILGPYINKGMTVLDLGCGPGFFTVELARLVGDEGTVIAADIQPLMLEKMKMKIRETSLEKRVEAHICQDNRIGISQKLDFVLAFWMIHEVPDKLGMFEELMSVLKPGGKILIVEPKFHVSRKSFKKMITILESTGLQILDRPKVSISRTVLLASPKQF